MTASLHIAATVHKPPPLCQKNGQSGSMFKLSYTPVSA
jgi:hypothetical protein